MSDSREEWKLTENGNVIAMHPGFQAIMRSVRKLPVERRVDMKLCRGNQVLGWFDDKGELHLVAGLKL